MARKPVQKDVAGEYTRRGDDSMTDEPGWALALERRGFWVAAAGLALLLVLFFNPIFFAGKEFQPPDVVASLAQRTYVQEAFHSEGSLLQRYPLWTPYIFSGMPSFGSLIAAPYTNPMSLLLTPIPGVFKVVTYYFLLGLFTWLLMRRLGLRALSALFGAVAFVFCAHVITLIMFGHNSKIATLIFLPLVLLATHELWQRITVALGGDPGPGHRHHARLLAPADLVLHALDRRALPGGGHHRLATAAHEGAGGAGALGRVGVRVRGGAGGERRTLPIRAGVLGALHPRRHRGRAPLRLRHQLELSPARDHDLLRALVHGLRPDHLLGMDALHRFSALHGDPGRSCSPRSRSRSGRVSA